MIFTKNDGQKTAAEPPADQIKNVTLSGEEFFALQQQITQLKQPWIRNACKDRDVRPARSHHGYVIKSIRDVIQREYGRDVSRIKLELETPYEIGSFSFAVAKSMIRGDMQQLREALHYDRIYFAGETASRTGRVMYDAQIVADSDKSYYRIQAYATVAPEG